MARLSTHVLDTAHGRPAAGVTVDVFRVTDAVRTPVAQAVTNHDGRTGAPLLGGDRIAPGIYELEFGLGDYFRRSGIDLSDPPFLDQVIVRIGLSDPTGDYHVPLLASPYAYSTYRGS
jgi:5-hydroxyisourate hydrolase